jgi:probable enterotoxin B
MQYAFYQGSGKKLPRTTYLQWNAGRRVAFAQRKPGDLLFYSNKGHVTLYVGRLQAGGPEYMIEAPRTGLRVRLTKVRSSGLVKTVARFL